MIYDSRKDTQQHIDYVRSFIGIIRDNLLIRADNHDTSKLKEPEKSVFDTYTPKLAKVTYGSDEYKTFLTGMKVALDHHYLKNSHHVEHFENGINGMTLVDIIEMISDWKAASLRHDDGDIFKSIEINQKRFGYSDDLKQILINTVKSYF